jgi:hypothetical protein
MFSEILYIYLKTHFSKEYSINPKYCFAIDVFNKSEVDYSQLEKRTIPAPLIPTLDEIRKLMSGKDHCLCLKRFGDRQRSLHEHFNQPLRS